MDYKQRFKQLEAKKTVWHNIYDFVDEYLYLRKQGHTNKTIHPSIDFDNDNYTSSPIQMLNKSASAFQANVFQSATDSIRISPSIHTENIEGAQDFFDKMTLKTVTKIDEPESGFHKAKAAVFKHTLSFGTIAKMIESGPDLWSIRCKAWTVRNIFIDTDADGQVNTIAYKNDYSLTNAAAKYGLESLSSEAVEKFGEESTKHTDKLEIVQIIQPNYKMNEGSLGPDGMPFESVHFELETGHVIKRSGFREFPAPVARPFLEEDETYGRSPSIENSADIYNLNVVLDKMLKALEKALNPPMGYDEEAMTGDTLDTSAGGYTPFNMQNVKGSPTFPLVDIGDLSAAPAMAQSIKEELTEAFFLDRLLNFNAQTEQTLGEAQMRMAIRLQSIVAPVQEYVRFYTDVIARIVSLLYRQGYYGVNPLEPGMLEELQADNPNIEFDIIPEAIGKVIKEGKEFYKIEFLTPATRQNEAVKFNTALQTMGAIGQLAQYDQNVLDNFNADNIARGIYKSQALPGDGLNSDKKVEEIRAQKVEIAKKQMEAQQNAAQQGQQEPQGGAEAPGFPTA